MQTTDQDAEPRGALNAVITWSLRNRLVVVCGALALVALGLISLQQLDVDAFPDTTPVQVQINTVAPSLSPEEVERQITFPVEQAISGLPGLQNVRSVSKFGLSVAMGRRAHHAAENRFFTPRPLRNMQPARKAAV